jgi:hypothetical protein
MALGSTVLSRRRLGTSKPYGYRSSPIRLVLVGALLGIGVGGQRIWAATSSRQRAGM